MVFLCSVSIIASATDYYVSSSGSDSANGLSSSTPWQTISKVNSVFSSLSPGDRILFKRGDVFYGSLKLSRSGSSGSPITIGAFGTGKSRLSPDLQQLQDGPIMAGEFTTKPSHVNHPPIWLQ